MVDSSLIIFAGSDEPAKRRKIESFQKELFPPDLKDFYYVVLHGDDKHLTQAEFKEALMSLPADGRGRRLVVIRTAHKLKKSFARCLKEALDKIKNSVVVILDVEDMKAGGTFVAEFSQLGAHIIRFSNAIEVNVFDLGRTILEHKPDKALKILSDILKREEKTDNVVGAVFWQWQRAYDNRRLTEASYKKGLGFILDADKRLKSSSSAFARHTMILEALTVKLSYLS